MEITVIQHQPHLQSSLFAEKIAVVIDVFRATSVITAAIAHGAKEIIACSTVEDAMEEFQNRGKEACILGGERKMQKIEGFHYGNSPQSYMENIRNKTVILTTTNGTRAIRQCENAAEIYIASMLNAKFLAQVLSRKNCDIQLICSGLKGNFALEDAICAGKILYHLQEYTEISMDDYSLCLQKLYELSKRDVSALIKKSADFIGLKNNGFESDATFCMQEDLYPVLPKSSHANKKLISNSNEKIELAHF